MDVVERISDSLRLILQAQSFNVAVQVIAMAHTVIALLAQGRQYGFKVAYLSWKQPLYVHVEAFWAPFCYIHEVFVSLIAEGLCCYTSQFIVIEEQSQHYHNVKRGRSDIGPDRAARDWKDSRHNQGYHSKNCGGR